MNTLADIITYVRRIIKSPSNADITDALIIDYINRFYIMDVDARLQLFDLKTTYQFQSSPVVDQYNMPLYNVQTESTNPSQTISMFPVYQGFFSPAYINGIQVPLDTLPSPFFNIWPNVVQNLEASAIGNGTAGPYQFTLPILGQNSALNPNNPPVQGILRGHVDITGIIATGVNQDPPFSNTLNTAIPSTSILPQVYINSLDTYGNTVTIQDSGQFLTDPFGNNLANVGMLMQPGKAPYGYNTLPGFVTSGTNYYSTMAAITGATNATSCVLTCTSNIPIGQYVTINGVGGMTQLNGQTYLVTANSGTTLTIAVDSTGFGTYTTGGTVSSICNYVNYVTGVVNVTFPVAIPLGQNIDVQCFYFQTGLPRGLLYYNNTLTLRSPPDQSYLVQVEAYLSPAAFFNTSQAIPFAYMAEYIARGAARKILSDTGDVEQFTFYEPLFREQEMLVWKRSQRQWTNNRTPTLYSQGFGNYGNANSSLGGSQI